MRYFPIKITCIVCTLVLLVGVISSSASAQSAPSLTIHDMQAEPQSDQFAYDVSVFFSLYDGSGDPITDLALADVSLMEDGKRVDPTEVETAEQEPINVVIVMDTSGSMSGTKMQAASQAAARFISRLGKDDQAALISFNSQVKNESDFTDNLDDIQEKVELLAAVRGSGTCFFDALYESIQLSASIPSGRRAIVILTDGVDETSSGATCSKYTDQDVIDLATNTMTRVPIYTLGFGNSVDADGLERLAARTGGAYQFAADAVQLDEVFTRLSQQLRSQYRLSYVSISPPGPHILALKVDTSTVHEQSTYEFILPPFPYRVVFVAPTEGEEIGAETTLSVQVLGQGEPIAKVEFFADGESLGVLETAPYELAWNPSFDSAQAKLEAAAYGEAGGELARSAVNVTLKQSVTSPEEEAAPVAEGRAAISPLLIGGIAAVVLVAVVVVLVIALRPKRREQERDREWKERVHGDGSFSSGFGEERTLDSFTPSENALGMLVILQSDDPAMIGQQIEIAKPITNLGRKADNDIIFTKDTPVSRHHAVIEERGGNLFLSEVMAIEDGSPKRPAYGTFVNGTQIEEPVLLHDGDEIRLGKRVRLRFEGLQHTSSDGERTLDQFDASDERTVDFDK
jgi:VWFA-related protein